jgi:hypothetical protein
LLTLIELKNLMLFYNHPHHHHLSKNRHHHQQLQDSQPAHPQANYCLADRASVS